MSKVEHLASATLLNHVNTCILYDSRTQMRLYAGAKDLNCIWLQEKVSLGLFTMKKSLTLNLNLSLTLNLVYAIKFELIRVRIGYVITK